MKRFYILLVSFLSFGTVFSQADSIDVQKYSIQLNLTDFKNSKISGVCDVVFKIIPNQVNGIGLELANLKADSIQWINKNSVNKCSFITVDSLITINHIFNKLTTDTFRIRVFYKGIPKKDKSGFGGVDINQSNGGYIYNLGIGLSSIPANLGKCWFPCVDNFRDRALFDIQLITDPTHLGFSNGKLISTSNDKNGNNIFQWSLSEPIVTYLACFAVGKYAIIEGKIKSIFGGEFPKIIYSYPSDSNNAVKSFYSLDTIFRYFESRFGKYRFKDKIGYVEVPENGGAMEHATAISFPEFGFQPGSETLYGHELSHHWFGNNYTCSSSQDMWLNEGWASFSESIVDEALKGKEGYIQNHKNNHALVVNQAHWYDKGYFPISPIPSNIAYGRHIYWKGHSVVHSLRYFMGDSLFFNIVKQFQDSFEFSSVNSFQMRDFFGRRAKMQKEMNQFFDVFVFDSGFVNFDIRRWNNDSSSKTLTLEIGQNLKKKSNYYQGPIEINVYDENRKRFNFNAKISGITSYIKINLPNDFIGKVKMCHLNEDIDIAEAKINGNFMTKFKSSTFTNSNLKIALTIDSTDEVTKTGDSINLYIEYHNAGVDPFYNNFGTTNISRDRYWKIEGYNLEKSRSKLTLKFDGRKDNFPTLQGFDQTLFLKNYKGDNFLLLFYKSDSGGNWSQVPKYQYKSTLGNLNDKIGSVTISNIKQGYYAFGYDNQVSIENKNNKAFDLKVFPNPSNGQFNVDIQSNEKEKDYNYKIISLDGRLIQSGFLNLGNNLLNINSLEISKGLYSLIIHSFIGTVQKLINIQ